MIKKLNYWYGSINKFWFCLQWVSDGSPTHSSTPVKIDGALQFVPKNTNPKEFKQLQQQVNVFFFLLYFQLFIIF